MLSVLCVISAVRPGRRPGADGRPVPGGDWSVRNLVMSQGWVRSPPPEGADGQGRGECGQPQPSSIGQSSTPARHEGGDEHIAGSGGADGCHLHDALRSVVRWDRSYAMAPFATGDDRQLDVATELSGGRVRIVGLGIAHGFDVLGTKTSICSSRPSTSPDHMPLESNPRRRRPLCPVRAVAPPIRQSRCILTWVAPTWGRSTATRVGRPPPGR